MVSGKKVRPDLPFESDLLTPDTLAQHLSEFCIHMIDPLEHLLNNWCFPAHC